MIVFETGVETLFVPAQLAVGQDTPEFPCPSSLVCRIRLESFGENLCRDWPKNHLNRANSDLHLRHFHLSQG